MCRYLLLSQKFHEISHYHMSCLINNRALNVSRIFVLFQVHALFDQD